MALFLENLKATWRCLCFALIVIISISGCKKETGLTNLIKTDLQIGMNPPDTLTTTMTYDGQGRILTSNGFDFQSYRYTNDSIVISFSDIGSKPQILYLNSKGLVVKVSNGDSLSYDGNNEKIYFGGLAGPAVVYNWSNDDVLYTYSPAAPASVDTFVYLSTIDNRNFGNPFYGKNPKHLLSLWHTGSITTYYTYTFDAQGRVKSQTSQQGSHSPTTDYYTYW